MKVETAEITFSAQTHQSSERRIEEQLTAGFVQEGEAFNEASLVNGAHWERSSEETAEANTYEDPRRALAYEQVGKISLQQLRRSATQEAGPKLLELTPEDQLKLDVIKTLFEKVMGRSLNVAMVNQSSEPTTSQPQENSSVQTGNLSINIPESPGLAFGLDYAYRETLITQTQQSFSASGKVTIADGRTLDIGLQLNLSREASQSRELRIRLGAALQDPLVINFSGESAQLQDKTWQFDIDVDGSEETLYRLKETSGYLALDKDNNGIIDDGSELFGAVSGNGFQDLQAYDDDQNGFIDENDTIFDQLTILVQAADGTDHMFTLKEKGVGALYLDSIETPWDIQAGTTNELAGKLRSTGVFLSEEGTAGTLQQIDLVV